uniref:Ice-binding protein isoform 5 n=1 Tax=Chlamydomonas sp. ICE-MDV TaxID=1983280 RepID=A0A1W6JGN2_9CHLO|nr:ice-binding protein isoform 5 [Chlamydomonas sp. ICE-MDV]
MPSAAMRWLAPIVLLLATSSICSVDMGNRKLLLPSIVPQPLTVDLKSAKKFTVLAATTVTNTGPTTVGGLLGVSPGSAVDETTEISYFAEPTPNKRASDADAAAAKKDVGDAYNDAAGRVENVVNIPVVNIGGHTYTPGLYKSTGALEVSSGTLYLSGKGIFIFQMEKTFLMSTGRKIILQDGAEACDIFWVVGSSATFEAGSVAVGTFMAHQAISLNTGASIVGRLFALNAAVTMQSNTVAFPSDASDRRRRQLQEALPVDLKTAKEFTVLAATTVTNSGPTTVGGLLGVSPGSAVEGETYISYSTLPTPNKRASTAAAEIAMADVADAYNDAAGRVENVVNIPVVNIGGLTFTPGLYKTTGALEVSSGTLYLSGKGVFIFQMETTFSMDTGREMILQDGAQACDIFWVVGSSVTFEANSVAVGTFMAHQSIAVKTGASITGRLFALNAAVTMLSNTVVFPADASNGNRRQLVEAEAYSTVAVSPPTVDLLFAEQFTVLAYATITNTGKSTVGGLIGVSPGTAVDTGISYSEVPTPNDRASDEDAATAKADVTTAYNDASGRVENVVNINVVNIGGLTFTPGLYKTTGALEVSSGTLYLRGNGVFIFQMETTFLINADLKMVLQDGAQACNVFWRVGSAAKFEVGSEAVGTFMAHTAIDALTGANITGRLFSLNAAVNLQGNVIAFPFKV